MLSARWIRTVVGGLVAAAALLARGAAAARTNSSTPRSRSRAACARVDERTRRSELRGRARLLPLPRAVQVRRHRRHARRARPFRAGKVKFDETFQKNVETHRDMLRIPVPVQQADGAFRLAVNYQGCADKGLCYPPTQMRADVQPGGVRRQRQREGAGRPRHADRRRGGPARRTGPAVGVNTASAADGAGIEAALRAGGFWTSRRRVLPRRHRAVVHALRAADGADPVVDHRRARAARARRARARGFALSRQLLARHGAGLHRARRRRRPGRRRAWPPALQNPWVLGAFALALVLLSLSMFGVYELQLPSALTGRARAGLAAPARRPLRRRVRDGRRVGADRQPLRRGAARRRAGVPQPDPRRRCSAARRCSRWPPA